VSIPTHLRANTRKIREKARPRVSRGVPRRREALTSRDAYGRSSTNRARIWVRELSPSFLSTSRRKDRRRALLRRGYARRAGTVAEHRDAKPRLTRRVAHAQPGPRERMRNRLGVEKRSYTI
jgi:hypothetical protein